MGRLTKEQRRLRDAVKGGPESEFCKAMYRMTTAAETTCKRMRKVVAAANALAHGRRRRRRAAFMQWAHDNGLQVGIATIAIHEETDDA